MKRLIYPSVVLVIAALIGVFLYWRSDVREALEFRSVTVQRGDLVVAVTATGTIEPVEVVDVGAQVNGRIKRFGEDPNDPTKRIDFGTLVQEGTVLAQIDEALYKAAVDQARANLKRADAEQTRARAVLKRAKADWDRAQTLVTKGTISSTDYDEKKANYEIANAEWLIANAGVEQAKSAVAEAETNLGYVTIKSPIDGVVLDRRVNVGQTVVSGLNAPSLFLLARDLRNLRVWASVNEADIGSIFPEQKAVFTVDAFPQQRFQGTVEQIRLNATMTQNVVTYAVMVSVDNQEGKLLPYMTANVQFEVARRIDALLVPIQALRWQPRLRLVIQEAREAYAARLQHEAARRNDSFFSSASANGVEKEAHVWIAAGQGLVRPVPVKLGLSNGVNYEVLETELQVGDRIVVGQARHTEPGFGKSFIRRKRPNVGS